MQLEIKEKAIFDNLDMTLQTLMSLIKKQVNNKFDINSINLVLEEILVNIISYGFPNCQPGFFKVSLDIIPSEKSLFIKIIDNGIPFNMLEKEDPDINTPLDERADGGWGIFFVKKLVDKVSYERINDNNIIKLKFANFG
ncbi:MAG TPA: ATP-binding protein [Victivallales bacterium]|nr:ATP-binding protein [Victivallales bacterium]